MAQINTNLEVPKNFWRKRHKNSRLARLTLEPDQAHRLRKRGVDVGDVDGTLIDLHSAGKPSTVKTYVRAIVCLLWEMPEQEGLLKEYRKHLSQPS